jgi:divalent metal cation (Fe/Co/Zn/Cd) transporter
VVSVSTSFTNLPAKVFAPVIAFALFSVGRRLINKSVNELF